MQVGYNYQMGNIELGIEANASLTDISELSTDSDPDTLFWRELNWTATVAPRIGFAAEQFLIYAKAGAAWGGFEVGHDQSGTNISSDSTEFGYVLGAGIEFAATQNWLVNFEYNYMDFCDDEININGSPDIQIEQGGDFHAIKLGLNYKF